MDVNLEAEPPFLDRDILKLNRNAVSKTFYGEMAGTSEAQTIAAFTATPGSAATWPLNISRDPWAARQGL